MKEKDNNMNSNFNLFSNSTMYAKDEMGLVNECLMSIGEVPYPDGSLPDLIQIGTDADVARRMIANTMLEVQSRGWFFNTDYNMVLSPDSGVGLGSEVQGGFIVMPPNVLRIDTGNQAEMRNRYIIKDSKIYDLFEQDYVQNRSIVADVIWLVDYELLPIEAYLYIAARASRKFQQRVIGSVDLNSLTMLDEQDTYNNLVRLQMQVNDYNLNNPVVSNRTHSGNIKVGLYYNKGRRQNL